MKGLIPRAFIDDLLIRTDIVELIDGYVPLKKRGHNHLACCPFHNEKTPSFNVIPKKQFYYCFGCGANGNAISFVMNYLHQSFSDAIETLATRSGLEVPREGRSEKNQQTITLYQFLDKIAQFYQQTLKTSGELAIAYLKRRQVSGEIAKQYRLGFAPAGWQTLENAFKGYKQELVATGMSIQKEDGKTYDRYRQRVMFPIHDRNGRIIGFGGRAIETSQNPKYLNSPETIIFQKSRELYGLHQALQHQENLTYMLIVEGYMDVLALAQHGIPHVVATLGTATSVYHIQLLSKYTKQLIFCFDGDGAGRKAAWRALESTLPQLNSGLDASFVFLPEGYDPDSLIRQEGRDAFSERLKQAIPLHRFFIETLTQALDLQNIAGQSQLLNNAKPYLQKMGEGPYKTLLMEALARLTRLEVYRMGQLLEEKTPEQTHIPNITRSPTRLAIALLLQHPEMYKACCTALPPTLLDEQKHRVLKTLMEYIIAHPEANTAQLVENWRETVVFDAISKLAAWDHQVPQAALVKEFGDIISFLAKQAQENQIQRLIKKARDGTLLEEERLQLQALLKQRHQVI